MDIKPGIVTVAAALVVGLSGCGSPTTNAGSEATSTTSQMSSPTVSAPVLITVKDFTFTIPGPVAPGATVMVRNADDQNHTVTSAQRGAFDIKADGGGGTATFRAPTKPGSYMFACTFHANMMGTLVVR